MAVDFVLPFVRNRFGRCISFNFGKKMDIDTLLQILACPACKGDLKFVELKDKQGFACDKCQKVYPIKDNIPVMLVEESEPIAIWKEGE